MTEAILQTFNYYVFLQGTILNVSGSANLRSKKNFLATCADAPNFAQSEAVVV